MLQRCMYIDFQHSSREIEDGTVKVNQREAICYCFWGRKFDAPPDNKDSEFFKFVSRSSIVYRTISSWKKTFVQEKFAFPFSLQTEGRV